jgi:hypothetical protein
MEKRQLAHGEVTVWRKEEGGVVLHHANGLTIALTVEEAEALFAWGKEGVDEKIAHMTDLNVTLTLTDQWQEELKKRFAEAKQDYPKLTMDSFIAWAVRYYLQHAYTIPGEEGEQE